MQDTAGIFLISCNRNRLSPDMMDVSMLIQNAKEGCGLDEKELLRQLQKQRPGALETAIAQYGAQVVEVKGNYDDAVRHAAQQAAANGWTVVSDTSYPGYRDIPSDVMHGYGVMAAEIGAQMAEPPTHVFVQAGVGALAAAICADFWIRWGERRPQFVVVEPLSAD